MWKRRKLSILLGCVLALIGVLLITFLAIHGEPRYHGRPITKLLDDAVNRRVHRFATPGYRNEGLYPDPAAQDAFRRVGTNALPQLITMISYEPSRLRLKISSWAQSARTSRFGWLVPRSLGKNRRAARTEWAVEGFRLLGPVASPAIPDLERLAKPPHGSETAARAVWALQGIGEGALPALRRLSLDPRNRRNAMTAMVQLGLNGAHVEPYLAQLLEDSDQDSYIVLYGLRRFPASIALPILTNALLEPRPRIRQYAAESIGFFGKEARCAMPILFQTVQDTNPAVRKGAIEALHYLAPEIFVTNKPTPYR